MVRPIYIFDLDGTLALNEHRQHFINGDGKKDWESFFNALDGDEPNHGVIETMRTLRKTCHVWIWTGRPEEYKEKTLDWLMNHKVIDNRQCRFWHREPNKFRMRTTGDRTEDYLLKQSWLRNLPEAYLNKIVGVFDDRQSVVDMWRSNGITCFQVAKGDF